ncbi:MAG: hypothetical protein K2K17_11280 [Lachnospiraceae bacterium]|nr:hypothetical protein [Lachnospiraceae bacterium]
MRKIWILLAILCLFLTSCNYTENNHEILSSTETGSESKTPEYFSADGVALNIDMQNYSDQAKLLTAEDIYLLSFNCGYISGNTPGMLVIENKEQLDYALERYGLALPSDDMTEDELWYYSTAIAEPFHEMIQNYPISEYSYVIEYDEVGCGGYDLRVGALLVDKDIMHFVHTADSKTPAPDSIQPDVMGGFCYMAAVPKDILPTEHYEGWTYPDINDISQAADYFFATYCLSDTTELYEVYGEKNYIIRTEEEYQTLVAMAESVTDHSGKSIITYNDKIDFDETVLLFQFYCFDGSTVRTMADGVEIQGNNITMTYQKNDGNYTGMAYAEIPVRFLTESDYNGWEKPDENSVSVPEPVQINMSAYSADAKFYTPDQIMMFCAPIGDLGFNGKYAIICNDDEMLNEMLIQAAYDDYGFGQDSSFNRLIDNNLWFENAFFVQYIGQTEENTDLRLMGLVVDGNKVDFLYYDNNEDQHYRTANGTGGFGMYAAVPISDITADRFEGWKIP